eukprot:jgi/Tetstr1/443552/TSEL_031553.t1
MRFGALAAVIVLLSVEEESDSFLGMLWRHSLYSVGLYTLLTSAQDLAAIYMTSSLGLQTKMHFGNPLLSERVATFWAKKWNLPVQSILRSLVYDPLLERTIIQTDAAKNSPSPAPGTPFLPAD